MDILTILGTAVALAMDAFAVSTAISAGLRVITPRHRFRLAWHFGLFQFFMPILGWISGAALTSILKYLDHWIAFGLLLFLGFRMIWNAQSDDLDEFRKVDPTRGWSLIGLSLATSIDAFAVGLSLGLLQMPIWVPALIIGIVTLSLSLLGTFIGQKIGGIFGQWAERIGGTVLILIGLRILIHHW